MVGSCGARPTCRPHSRLRRPLPARRRAAQRDAAAILGSSVADSIVIGPLGTVRETSSEVIFHEVRGPVLHHPSAGTRIVKSTCRETIAPRFGGEQLLTNPKMLPAADSDTAPSSSSFPLPNRILDCIEHSMSPSSGRGNVQGVRSDDSYPSGQGLRPRLPRMTCFVAPRFPFPLS